MFDKALLSLKDEMIQALCTNLRIQSDAQPPEEGKPNGPGVARALEHALRVAAQLGFSIKEVDGHAGYAEYGEGEEMVAVLGHLDVVPAGEGWQHPPYAGIIENGRIYGRGTTDDKGPMFAALFALKAIKDSGLPLRRRIRILFGTSEETGSADMAYYSTHEELPLAGFTPDAKFPVINAEKGILNIWFIKEFSDLEEAAVALNRLQCGSALNMVPAQATAELALHGQVIQVKTSGVSAHASRPESGQSAAAPMLDFLSHQDLPLTMQDAFAFLAYSLGQETLGENLGLAMEDEVSGKLTINLGMLEADMHQIRGGLNIRYPVTASKDLVLSKLSASLYEGGFDIESITNTPPLYVDESTELVRILMDVFSKKTGLDLSPMSTGGGTYARSLPNILAFGPQFPEQSDLCHQADEYVEIPYLIKTAQIMASAMYELAK